MPYLWDKTFTLEEVNEKTFKNKPLKLAFQFSSLAYRKGKMLFSFKGPILLLSTNVKYNVSSVNIYYMLTIEKAFHWHCDKLQRWQKYGTCS